MLPSTAHVQEIYNGSDGILAADGKHSYGGPFPGVLCLLATQRGDPYIPGGMRPSLLIDCSTISPVAAKELSQETVASSRLHQGAAPFPGCSNRCATMVDAPVSGGVPGARAATLTFMVGGLQCCSTAEDRSKKRSPFCVLILSCRELRSVEGRRQQWMPQGLS